MDGMALGGHETLTRPEAAVSEAPAGPVCLRCGAPDGAPTPVAALPLGPAVVRRCTGCGTRSAEHLGRSSLLFTCENCGVPFLASDLLPHGEQSCPACRQGTVPPDLPDHALSAATESEVRRALPRAWNFVSSPLAQPYLDRIARTIAGRIDDAPAAAAVVVIDDPAHKTLALPSGTVLLSLGTLAFLEDEAELVFVLGHEIAHAASGEAAVRLSRIGLLAAARGPASSEPDRWADAALDLVRLGYGRRRERDADARAVDAMIGLGYDPEAAGRYLRRLAERIRAHDPAVTDLATAHTTPADRIRRIERSLYGRVPGSGMLKVNREVFRRAAGGPVLASTFSRCELDARPRVGPVGATPLEATSRRGRLLWWLAAALVVAAAAAAFVLAT